jgi:hypothetical protein
MVEFDVAGTVKILDQLPVPFPDTAGRSIVVVVRVFS